MHFSQSSAKPPVSTEAHHESLGKALFKVIAGIENTWKLKQNELANILHRDQSTVSTWKGKKAVSVGRGTVTPNDRHLFEFIELFDSLSSLFIRVDDQVNWLRSPSTEFGDVSPYELLVADSKNLFALREFVDRNSRP